MSESRNTNTIKSEFQLTATKTGKAEEAPPSGSRNRFPSA